MPKLLTEEQLERLREFEARKQAGEKLNAEERLEQRRLRAEQKAAAAAEQLAAVNNAEKRRLDRRRYEIGKLATEAGLGNFPAERLRHGFARLAEFLNRSIGGSVDGSSPNPASPPLPGPASATGDVCEAENGLGAGSL